MNLTLAILFQCTSWSRVVELLMTSRRFLLVSGFLFSLSCALRVSCWMATMDDSCVGCSGSPRLSVSTSGSFVYRRLALGATVSVAVSSISPPADR